MKNSVKANPVGLLVDYQSTPFMPFFDRGGRLELASRQMTNRITGTQRWKGGKSVMLRKFPATHGRPMSDARTDEEVFWEFTTRISSPVYGAQLLDYVLAPENQTSIPKSWIGRKDIYFLGTVYQCSLNKLYVRCLYWNSCCWAHRAVNVSLMMNKGLDGMDAYILCER